MEQKLKQIAEWGYRPLVKFRPQTWSNGNKVWEAEVYSVGEVPDCPVTDWKHFIGDSPEIVVEDMYLYVKDRVDNE